MNTRIIWSALILAAPIVVYFWIIRPRLKARYVDTYAHIEDFWARQWARIVAFRTAVIAYVGIYLSELPAALEALQLVDLSFLPEAWQSTIRIVTIVAMLITRATATTPASDPEKL